jgi:hypothetical protein
MNLDHLLKEVASAEPTPVEVERAASRVRERLFPRAVTDPASPTVSTGTIRSCEDFVSLIPAYLAGSLDEGRKLLFEVHTRECVACRKALSAARNTGNVIEFRPKRQAAPPYVRWAIAAAALLMTGTVSYIGLQQFPAIGGGPRATVETVDGGIYKVAGSSLFPLAPGAALDENDVVRTARNSTAMLKLNDGSRIELNERSQVSVTRTWSGSTIHLALGKIIVEAAKQRSGSLRVTTADCNVQVKGTVFSVDSGTLGSRVAVVEGTVWVDHGQRHDVLHKGQVTATNAEMAKVPIREEFEWSRKSDSYLALLKDFGEMRNEIAAIPAAPVRFGSDLLPLLPGDVSAVATIPNIGGAVAEASRIFHERLRTSAPLAAWWNGLKATDRSRLENTLQGLETASGYLGNEIIIATRGGRGSPLIVAQTVKPGLDAFLKRKLPPETFDGHMRFDNGLFVAAGEPGDLASVARNGGFDRTGLYQRLLPSYKQGASWLAGVDLLYMPGFSAARVGPGVSDARYIVAESRTVPAEAGKPAQSENRASVGFARKRQGVAAWLSAPGPMGSLDFVSPDAQVSVSMLMKSASVIVEDLMNMAGRAVGKNSGPAGTTEQPANELRTEMASAFGGEITVALDGPIFPTPSWKVAAEVYYPERLQSALAKMVQRYNDSADKERTGNLQLTQSDLDGRAYYQLKIEKLPWEAHWTFIDGYWVAGANRELVARAIQNRQTGFTLAKSEAFRSKLPASGSTGFSAVVYHNLGSTLAPVADMLGNTNFRGLPMNLLKSADAPGAICFWAAPDRIDVAATGGLFGMSMESMLAMGATAGGSGPFGMLGHVVGGTPGANPEAPVRSRR